ncbi:DNA-binding transcriptional regulator, LacI/PurR family [Halobacillus karajensis]|uniref:Glucose-resistance amylase regulator n=1 Tax=Halobacillus karajensis TaxID=195088 RepID=A0A059NWM2_9BACI|nr:LacI family DNA-binding transcriptional regulator [Halobacillus karajensis]CDQ19002.1 Glucose-resistance amylase regulator [Halobacillus karajensis]CDQ22924.1 Glucose-resistance amylase regulator [Halobacillus karajensis]CDQ26406.1 Glucose-resistance amylase regulator [Halobacillus karajensis]SEH43135.1 DNA-binding transcriptional regulator, LacI/PurR family [Halobacillus karajensis]
MDNKKVTATDVARLAGVSQSSVSRVFSSNSSSVTKEKRKAIIEAANKLGYQPNAIARGLITNKSHIIGIVMRDIKNPFYPEVLEKFYSRLTDIGYQVIFINSMNHQIEEDEISRLIEYNAEAVIITDAILTSSAVERFVRNNIPIVLFNRYIPNSKCSAVSCKNYEAGKAIGKYLIEKGHRNPAFISGPFNTSTTIDRQRGYQEALSEGGISKLIIEDGKYTYEGGYEAAANLIRDHKNLDSIFCGNDISAFGAIDAIKAANKLVPEDISVIGFDDVQTSKWFPYSLTTWKQPVDEMVEKTISILMNDLNGKSKTPEIVELDGHLVTRNSVKDRTDK